MEQVILVDKFDNPIGQMEKMLAHHTGILHRAFSILIYNSKGEMLLQQRAENKYHSAGLWSNACCSHPKPGEEILDAAHRRLHEELNIHCNLEVTGHFTYHHQFEKNLFEHEYDYVLKGICDNEPKANPLEVKAFRWIDKNDLIEDVQLHPQNYAFWFKKIIRLKLF